MKNKDIVKINLEDEKEDDKESFKKTFKEMPIKNIVRKKIPKNKKSGNHKKIHVQGKKKLLTSFHISPEINLSAQELLEHSAEEKDNLEMAEDLISQAEELIEEEKEKEKKADEIPEIEPNIKRDEKKEVMEGNIQGINIGEDYFNLKVCPVCSGKLKKSAVKKIEGNLIQNIKCKECVFEKEIKFKL